MSMFYWWWLLAIGLAVAEMFTGTFYLLIIALGVAFGGLAAYLGYGLAAQMVSAAVITVMGWLALRLMRGKFGIADVSPGVDNMQLDIGARLDVPQWQEARRARVSYRGALWTVELADPNGRGQPGQYQIQSIQGSTLIVRAV